MSEFNPEVVRAKVVADYPLFSKFLFSLNTLEDSKVTKTTCTDGKRIAYNKKFMDGRHPQDQFFMYCHELAHVFLGHHLRITKEHKPKIAQEAADYAVNDLLHDAGLIVPHDALFDYKYVGMGFEEIYKLLDERDRYDQDKSKHDPEQHGEVEPDDGSGDGDGQDGDEKSDDPHAGKHQQEQRQEKLEEHAKLQAESIQQGRMMGNLGMSMERYLDKLTETHTDWRELLPTTIEDMNGQTDYDWMKPDNRFPDGDFILPAMIGEKQGVVVLMMDTSGSIRPDQLKKMAGEVLPILEDTKPEKIYVIWADRMVRNVQELDGFEDVELKPKGGGGTDFRPAFEYLEENDIRPESVVYMTDGYCDKYPEEPDFPVIWLVWQKDHKITTPFGKVVVMNDK